MLMPWQESYNLGIPSLDRQHLKLVNMLNELGSAMEQGRGRVIAAEIMDQLSPFIRSHFEEEEKTLRQLNSPAYYQLRSKHEQDLGKIHEFLRGNHASDPSAVIDLLYLLDNLLQGHIESDRQALGLTAEGRVQ